MTGVTGATCSVSVVIPTRNGAAWLPATLQSVFDQVVAPLEVIVVDDGSTDETLTVLAPHVDAGRVRVVSQPHGGTARARNTGVRHARGDCIALLDHDDLWPPDKLAWQVQALQQSAEAVLVYGYMQSFGLERPFQWPRADGPRGHVAKAFRRKNWIRSPGQTLICTGALREVGGFDEQVSGADDWDLYLKLADLGPFVYEHRLALQYRSHRGNQSRHAWTLFRHACRVQERHAGAWPKPATFVPWMKCRATLIHMLLRDLRGSAR